MKRQKKLELSRETIAKLQNNESDDQGKCQATGTCDIKK
jgi:hypothetical protein